jgi:hypothetical protein
MKVEMDLVQKNSRARQIDCCCARGFCPRGIRARRRLEETNPYNGVAVVCSASEHGTGSSPHDTTMLPSLG